MLHRLERARPEAGPHRVAVHDRVLDDHVRADRHERRVDLERRAWSAERLGATRARRRGAALADERLARRSTVASSARRALDVGDARVLGRSSAVDSSIDTTWPWPRSSQIDARNSARPPSPVPVSMIQSGRTVATISWYATRSVGALRDAAAEPRRAAPREAAPERLDERRRAARRGSASAWSAGRRARSAAPPCRRRSAVIRRGAVRRRAAATRCVPT